MLWFRTIENAHRAWPPPRSRVESARLLDEARRRDPWGHWVHLALACAYAFLLPLLTFPKDLALGFVFLCAIVRLPATWRCCAALMRDWGHTFLWLWGLWIAAGLLWSDDLGEGWLDFRSYRVVLTGFAIWPVVRYAKWMIIALLIGVVAQHGVQLCQAMQWFGAQAGADKRLGGWLHPIHTATFCAAATCLHLAGLLRSRSWWTRSVFTAGLIAATAGLVATGSRGPWLAGGAAVLLMLGITTIRRAETRLPAVVVTVAALLALAIAWPWAKPMVEKRWEQTWRDVERMDDDGSVRSDVGTRLASWRAAWEMFVTSPIVGVGTGDFPAEVARTPSGASVPDAAHAHSTYLHVLACNGAAGFALMTVCFVLTLRAAWRDPADSVFADGMFFTMLAWLIAAMFDAYQQNGQMFGLFTLLAILTSALRPERIKPRRH